MYWKSEELQVGFWVQWLDILKAVIAPSKGLTHKYDLSTLPSGPLAISVTDPEADSEQLREVNGLLVWMDSWVEQNYQNILVLFRELWK